MLYYAILSKPTGDKNMNSGVNYKLFYDILLNLRETFHSYGRIDDSNSKLDEIVKLILLSYYYATQEKKFSLELVRKKSKEMYGEDSQIAPALRAMFDEAQKFPLYVNADKTSIFGANPALNIQPSENLFAERIISEIEKIDFQNLISEKQHSNFDILNECFGHFVRENFRNNKEDAQYMTPAEITSAVAEMVFYDFKKEGYFSKNKTDNFTVMDPTCGVGTLLIEGAKKYIDFLNESAPQDKESTINRFLSCGVVGQDKVDRMVRLSKINLLLFGGNSENISIGNSIADTTDIDQYRGSVDFIFTNPPFGAEYNFAKLHYNDYKHLDCLCSYNRGCSSEILMLLKCLALLKKGGKLAIVLPDSVVSAKGINETVRAILRENYTINAVIEMPAVTFAQAGTRTKTSILYLTNRPPTKNDKIIMGICNEVGYTVKERQGVPVKIESGENEMGMISQIYCTEAREKTILSEKPSVTAIDCHSLISGILNPGFYSFDRLQTVSSLCERDNNDYEMRPLSSIVRFETIGRKNLLTSDDTKHISVLHINPDCTIDFQQVIDYEPISKGRACYSGDILFSKINPRIPRMTVIPEFDKTLVCSNEFEILQPIADIGAYAICFLLRTSYVRAQIANLTSGTSSSHSRIKREQLASILIPYPKTDRAKKYLNDIDLVIMTGFNQKYAADKDLRQQMDLLEDI